MTLRIIIRTNSGQDTVVDAGCARQIWNVVVEEQNILFFRRGCHSVIGNDHNVHAAEDSTFFHALQQCFDLLVDIHDLIVDLTKNVIQLHSIIKIKY